MKRCFTVILIVYSLLLAGCPATLGKAKSASSKLATYANTGVDITRTLFREQLISIDRKDKIADAFTALAKAGAAFDLAVANVEREYGGSVPKSEIEKLFAVFDSEVVERFLVVLKSLKIAPSVGGYGEAIDLLTSAVLIIAGAFGRKRMIEVKIAAVA